MQAPKHVDVLCRAYLDGELLCCASNEGLLDVNPTPSLDTPLDDPARRDFRLGGLAPRQGGLAMLTLAFMDRVSDSIVPGRDTFRDPGGRIGAAHSPGRRPLTLAFDEHRCHRRDLPVLLPKPFPQEPAQHPSLSPKSRLTGTPGGVLLLPRATVADQTSKPCLAARCMPRRLPIPRAALAIEC